jgi:hypothetical protein
MIVRAYSNSFKMCSTSLRLQGLSSMTFAFNVWGMIFVWSLHGFCMGFVVIYHGKMFTSWRIIRLLLWIFISFHTPYISMALFPTPVTFTCSLLWTYFVNCVLEISYTSSWLSSFSFVFVPHIVSLLESTCVTLNLWPSHIPSHNTIAPSTTMFHVVP